MGKAPLCLKMNVVFLCGFGEQADTLSSNVAHSECIRGIEAISSCGGLKSTHGPFQSFSVDCISVISVCFSPLRRYAITNSSRLWR